VVLPPSPLYCAQTTVALAFTLSAGATLTTEQLVARLVAGIGDTTLSPTVTRTSGTYMYNVIELRLGFSNTTRNLEGILSHSNRKG
jgi:hypothetical protein